MDIKRSIKLDVLKKLSLKQRLMLLITVLVVPLICMIIGILGMVFNYSKSYEQIMHNVKVANEYNIRFKEDMEYSMYRVMIGLIDVEEFENGDIYDGTSEYASVVKNPYRIIENARTDFSENLTRTPGSDSDIKIKGILYCLNSLEKAVERMMANSQISSLYTENAAIWENDIQGLCSMIQDYITQYVYFETLKMEELHKALEYHTNQAVVVVVVTFISILTMGLILTVMLTRSVTVPLYGIQKTAERLGRGELEVRAAMCGLEEINVLARTFNTMSSQIMELMDKMRQEQDNLRILELKLRQEQITPHFLYNTLDSIVWMAQAGDNRQVVEMTSDLSDFFRTVLSEGKDYITVKEEIFHIKSYLKIQKTRYEDILNYKINVEPEIRDKIVLKMVLQPIVENALYHGLKNKRGGGTIFIRGYEEQGGLVFEVEDNGVGMDEETLASLKKKLSINDSQYSGVEENGGFGLRNVVQRIYMFYGKESSITLESEKNVGSCVKIYLGKNDKITQKNQKKI